MNQYLKYNYTKLLGIRIDGIIQYFLIYIMLLIPGSTFVYITGGSEIYYLLVAIFSVALLLVKKVRESYGIIFCGVLLISTLLTRALSGGAGIDSWLQLAGCVAITQMAICCNYERFLDRWIRSVVVFALISIVLWAILCAFPSLVTTLLGPSFLVDTIGTYPWQTYEYGSGQLFYSWLDIHSTRNCGLYTEPGKYQVVLNSALFVLLFWRDRLRFRGELGYKLSLFTIVVALVSCQSTTGYIGMAAILVVYVLFFRQKKELGNAKYYIIGIILVLMISLLADYYLNADKSILHQQVISKIFGNTGFDLSSGTGIYRAEMIELCISTILSNPLGVGYDRLFQLASGFGGGGLVAASLVQFGAVYGIIPWIAALFLIVYPVIKGCSAPTAVLFVFLFVNTTLAQTHFLYTSLLMIPMYLAIGQGWPLRRVEAAPKGGSNWGRR
ncbi:hypothetical protein ACULPM_08255 [Thermophilibacter sp. ZX-H3]|uniref:hypothetical protein n=1 Tax=unclassified Thermophilibacter TaxID=2847308 RepID=UPI0040407FCA